MKHLFILATLFVITSNSTFSQTIQVELTDTIQVEPDEFHYTIFIQKEGKGQRLVTQEESNHVPFDMQKLDDIILKYPKIEKHKPNTPNVLAAVYGNSFQTVDIKSTSFKQLMALEADLEALPEGKGFVSNIAVNYNPDHELTLKQKLLAKAEVKGKQTSKLLGKTLGLIIATEESEMTNLNTNNSGDGGWTGLPPMPGWHSNLNTEGLTQSEKSTLSLTMKIKYQLK